MSNISVTTTQNVIAVTETGGITVTTPEGQTIEVTVPNTSVDVTTTTDDITITEVGITDTDQLIEGTTNLFFTNARARAAISLTTDDNTILDYNSSTGVFTWDTPTTTKINEGTNLYYTTARANSDFDTRLATKTTTNLAEGANLYYTTARANSDFDTRLATKDTDDLAEGSTNQYFTQARARASLSAGTGISYDSNTGVITNTSINTDTTYTQNASATTGGANLNLVGSDSTTDSVKFASGTNITVSRTDANTITFDGTDLNTTYTIASASTTGGANLTLTGSDSSTDSVAYKGAGATTVTSTDANTITITSTDTNTTYTQNASAATGGANLNLVGSDSTTDTIKFANGTNVTVTRTDADTITIASTDTNTTYTVDATATTGGANLNLTGSDSSTDSVAYLGSGATTVTRTDANTITISSTDNNTTYTQNFSSTTGGTNLNLVGSDSTTDTVKFANGTGVTVSYTDADTATIAIGQSVGTGDNPTFAGATLGAVTVGVDSDQTISTSSGNLILQTAAGTNAGTMTLTAGANGAITLAPNGTGNAAFTFNDGGNLTNSRNYIFGAIRNSGTQSRGNEWELLAGASPTQPFRGITLDNSADTTRLPGYIARSYSNTTGFRGRLIFERARFTGTVATPAAVQNGDFLGEVAVTGYSSTGWINDNLALVPGFFGFNAAENWVSNTNLGTSFTLSLAPTATTISTGANNINVISVNPQAFASRSDSFTWANGKTGTTQTMALDVSGNLTVTGDIRVNGNDIRSSGNTSQIVMSSAGATLELRGNEIQLEDASGTAIKGGLINYRRTHGCFHKIANVTAAAANTVYEFDWYTDTTVHVGNQGVTVTSGNPTRVNIDTAGRYTAFIEFQVKNTVTANRVAWIWLAKNGTDLSETRIKVEIKQGGGTDAYQLINKLWLLENIAANDYIEVRFAVDNITGISLEYEAAQTSPFAMPAQPSATLTIVPVGA